MKQRLFGAFFGLLALVFFTCKSSESDKNVGQPRPDAQLLKAETRPNSELRIDPSCWWAGMKNPTLELMVRRKNVADCTVKIGKWEGVRLVKTERGESPNYLFVELSVYANAKTGRMPLIFEQKDGSQFVVEYEILPRESGPKGSGVTSKEVVYLLMPDRFANGDTTNDNIAGMGEPQVFRDSLLRRHGGDLKGVSDHLDYIQELGATAIWLNPELENDQARESYHGYAITDHYNIDRRFGDNELYRDFVKKCHQKDLKVIRDVIYNHVGIGHFWMDDLPFNDWIHKWDTFTKTTYRAPTLVDPYASNAEKKRFSDGWFDTHMPDLNQQNPHLARYLIQNTIWWIEWAQIDGLRIDTYTYSDQKFMSDLCAAIRNEYPQITMWGEVWEHGVPMQSYFGDDQPVAVSRNMDSNLPGLIDFQLQYAINEALNREQGWTEGAARIYYTLAQDGLYKDPLQNLTWVDNHDFNRIYTSLGEDYNKWKSAIAFLLTVRGTPQIYYGTELLMSGEGWKSHGLIRQEMPGGWPGDKRSVFTAAGRTEKENAAFNFCQKLLRFRKGNSALQTGKTTQFVPEKSIYTFFRHDDATSVMVILNTSNAPATVPTGRYAERLTGFSKARDVATDSIYTDLTRFSIPKNSPLVLELLK